MRTKQYAALFAFIAAFAMSAVAANFFKVEKGAVVLWDEAQTAQKINELLTADVANGHERALDKDYVGAVLSYTNEMETLDDANLPSDFRSAWREHKRAWRVQSNLLLNAERYRSTGRLQMMWGRNNDEISRTWYKLLEIAEKHNAEIPDGAYDE